VAAAPAPPPTAAAEAEPYVPHRSDLFRAGNIIDGRFKVIKRLADGGFAVVYRATDLTTRNEVNSATKAPGTACAVNHQ
jgi:hypothetical protein